MNAIDRPEHDFHRAIDVDLQDAWEDVSASPIPILKPFQKDLTYGRARGNTWGYQSNKSRERKRMDKFLYTGSLKTIALDESQDVMGRLGRLGIGLKTEVDMWEKESMEKLVVRGKSREKPQKQYISQRAVAILQEKGFLDQEKLVRTKVNAWVSDHFGITVGVKVLKERLSTP